MGRSTGGSFVQEILVTPPRNGEESNFQLLKDSSPEWGGVPGGVFWGTGRSPGGVFEVTPPHFKEADREP